ncbi:MAG: dienelactone hydrolase family protein [Thiohalocapsa sp.]
MNRTTSVLLLAALLPAVAPAHVRAEIQTETIEYKDGETSLKGHLVYDDSIEGKRPGVMVVHEWWGLNDYAKKRTEMLAELGYVAFAADMYGDDKVTDHAPDAKGWMQQITGNVDAWQARALSGLEILKGSELVDDDKLAAIGYCFGGATVMQMAYAGADLDGVVSFHGSLPAAPDDADIKAKVLAAHGYADGFVPAEQVDAFEKSLAAAGADWQLAVYSDARHAFTNPNAGEYGIDMLQYNPEADKRSWALMQSFLGEIFVD